MITSTSIATKKLIFQDIKANRSFIFHSDWLTFLFFFSKLQNVFLSSNTETWTDRKGWYKRWAFASAREAKDVQRKQINSVANRQRPWRTVFTADVLHSQQRDRSGSDLLIEPHISVRKQRQRLNLCRHFKALLRGAAAEELRESIQSKSSETCNVVLLSFSFIRSEVYWRNEQTKLLI